MVIGKTKVFKIVPRSRTNPASFRVIVQKTIGLL